MGWEMSKAVRLAIGKLREYMMACCVLTCMMTGCVIAHADALVGASFTHLGFIFTPFDFILCARLTC